MANWTQVKKVPELEGITCDVEREGDSIKVITLTDKSGGVVRIKSGESYCGSLHVFEPAKPKMVKRWRLTWAAPDSADFTGHKDFEAEYLAQRARADLPEGLSGTVAEVEIPDPESAP